MPPLDSRAALRAFGGFLAGLAIWLFFSPLYDRPLAHAATFLLRASENPPVTRLRPVENHGFAIDRSDFDPRSPRPVIAIRNLTVSFMLLTALFASAKRPFSDRNALGFFLASIALAAGHLFGVIAEVMSIYTLKLGMWSDVNYGAFARNFWGAASHAYKLVLTFGFAIAAWWVFRPGEEEAKPKRRKRT